MMEVSIDESGRDVNVRAGGSFAEVAVNIIQVVRVVYDQIKNANAEAGQYFRDGFLRLVNDEKIWQTDALTHNGSAMASVVFMDKPEDCDAKGGDDD